MLFPVQICNSFPYHWAEVSAVTDMSGANQFADICWLTEISKQGEQDTSSLCGIRESTDQRDGHDANSI